MVRSAFDGCQGQKPPQVLAFTGGKTRDAKRTLGSRARHHARMSKRTEGAYAGHSGDEEGAWCG
jgi:hypothetical protein